MGKETKIGLAVIGVLATIFCSVLYYKLTGGDEPLAEADQPPKAAKAEASAKSTGKSKLIPGDVDTPLNSHRGKWEQAGTADHDSDEQNTDRARGRYFAASDDASSSTDIADDSAPAQASHDPFASRRPTQSEAAETAADVDTASLDNSSVDDLASPAASDAADESFPLNARSGEKFVPLPAKAAAQLAAAEREQSAAEGAEEGDAPPARKASNNQSIDNQLTGKRQNDSTSRRSQPGQPTLATEMARSSVEQASDQQPTETRTPLRARAAQQVAAAADDDRYGRASEEDEVVATPGARRTADDFAADREVPATRPQRLGAATGNRPKPARVSVENNRYKVQPNDNYWTISEKVYGSGNYFKAIHEHNRLQHPESDKLSVGDVIEVLPEAELLKRYPSLCPKPRAAAPAKSLAVQTSAQQRVGRRIYVVEQGDTLFDIARHELGKASRWAEIYDLNREALGEDFDFLQPGTELNLPENARDTDAITRQNDERYRR